jgi:hypothetical protein
MLPRAAVAGALLWCVPVPGLAQQPVPAGDEFQVNPPLQRASSPSVSGDGNGNFVVVWSSYGGTTAPSDVWAQRYDTAGNPQGTTFRVNTYTTGLQTSPAVSMNDSGAFVVVWRSPYRDGSWDGVIGQRFDTSGTPVGPEFVVNAATLGFQVRPKVALAEDGRFVVVWVGSAQGEVYGGVFGRRFDADGNPQGRDFPLSESSVELSGSDPAVDMSPSGQFVVAWACCESPTRVLSRAFDASGAPWGPASRVDSAATSSQAVPSVAMDAAGNFVVAWSTTGGIRARQFDGLGIPRGDSFQVSTYFTRMASRPSIDVTATGEFVVAWQASQYTSPAHRSFGDIVARSFDATAQPMGPEFRVNTYTTGYQRAPSVAGGPAGSFLVAWNEDGQSGSRFGVFARRYVTPPDLIFADGFESGDVSAWSASQTDAGDLAVTGAAAMASTAFGAQATVDDRTGLYVQDDSPNGETRYRARFYLDPSGFDPGEASGHFRTRVLLAFEDAPLKRLVQVVLRRIGGEYSLAASVRRDDDTLADTGFAAISAAPHVVEIDWFRSSRPGANDGTFELWIDGASVAVLSGLDNDTRSVEFVRLGALSVKDGAAGTLRFDEFASRRWSYIGTP